MMKLSLQLPDLCFLLALAAHYNWEVHQLNIKTAFLNGVLDEEIYMDQPEGFSVLEGEGKVCRLQKALYGLKQAGHQWYQHLQQTLVDARFQELIVVDVSIFFMHHDGGDITIILVYVDNMAIFCSTLALIKLFKQLITSKYKYTNLRELKQLLGLNITCDCKNKTISIDQHHYI